MKTCNRILMTAILGMSLGSQAWAQTAGGSQNQTGGSTPGDSGGTMTTSSDAMGNQAANTSRQMSGASDADAAIAAQLDKLASMPDKAADGLFVLDNANGNLFEVEFARLAQQKAQDQKIKDLAKMIEQDHSQANDQLKPIASKMGLQLPTALPTQKQKMLQVLSAMSVQDFETCYLLDNKMVHAKDITSFADHQKSVKDEDLRKYITAVLPKLQQHGMHVSQLAAQKGYPTPPAIGASASGAAAGHSAAGHSATGAMPPKEGASGVGAGTDMQNPSNR